MPGNHPIPFENNPLWYKDVTIYYIDWVHEATSRLRKKGF
jgi:hypothetical protein